MNVIHLDKYNFNTVVTSFESIETDPRYMVTFKCRRLAEIAAIDILNMKKLPTNGNLQQKIESACSASKLASWLKFYWHTIRELGNEGVYIKDQRSNRKESDEIPSPKFQRYKYLAYVQRRNIAYMAKVTRRNINEKRVSPILAKLPCKSLFHS